MTRRDTIIIAVLVNAGLLAILFMIAISGDDDKVTEPSEIHQTVTEVQQAPTTPEPIPVAVVQPTGDDEVDNVLKDFAASPAAQSDIVDDTPGPTETPPPANDSDNSDTMKEAEESTDKYVEVTVKRGDALEKIARANGTTVDAIKKANKMTNERISVGQVLRIPVGDKTAAKKPEIVKPAAAAKAIAPAAKAPDASKNVADGDSQYYTIKKGDNPWKIAKQFNVKFDELLKMNNLDEEKARNLKIGDQIRVR